VGALRRLRLNGAECTPFPGRLGQHRCGHARGPPGAATGM
jgi:hypothetical protein